MAAIERDYDERPATVEIIVRLEANAAELLGELMKRTGWSASELVGWSLGAQWRELEGIVLPPPELQEDIEDVLRQSEEDVRVGRTSTNEEVFARIAAKHGW